MADQVAVILQARTGSSRLPGKVLADLAGRPMLAFLVERLKRCSAVDRVLLATTDSQKMMLLLRLVRNLANVCRGSKNDVLSRYALAAEQTDARFWVRITGDCPFIDPVLEQMIDDFCSQDIDYFSNCLFPTYPDGLDIEVFTRRSLLLAQAECADPYQREHVTPWIQKCGRFRLDHKQHHVDLSPR